MKTKVTLMHVSGKKIVAVVENKKGKTPVQLALMKLPKKIRSECALQA